MVDKNEQIKILVNGNVYNVIDKIDHVFESIFIQNFSVYYLMSIDTIKQHMVAAVELAEEFLFLFPSKIPVKITRLIRSMRKMVRGEEEKNILLKFISDRILAGDGLSVLPGFGYAATENVEGKIKVKTRLYIKPEENYLRGRY